MNNLGSPVLSDTARCEVDVVLSAFTRKLENAATSVLKALLYQLSYTTNVVASLELATDVVPTAFAAVKSPTRCRRWY
ncbi:MAG TPA: hypothetical protein VMZ26_07530 [Pyrinomonadaceae bacterium]|nr:hypothetical protein [Pyrinomonadaceae bacterium]